MTAEATISTAVLDGFDRRLATLGVDPWELAQCCAIPEDVWPQEPERAGEARDIPLTDFVGFLELASSRGREPGFGWNAGQAFDLRALGELGNAVLRAPTLGAALGTFASFLRLVQSTTDLRLEVEQDSAVLSYRILDPDIWPRQQDAEFSLSIFTVLIRSCLGADWRPSSLSFEHGPSRSIQGWNERLDTPCSFEAGINALAFPAACLARPMPAPDPAAWCRQTGSLGRALADRNGSRRTTERVASAVFSALGRKAVDLGDIARELGLSRRTLHRRLEAEGTRYSDILNDCRLRLAQQRLSRSEAPLGQIAMDLGYSDQTAFTRAFRQHCGVTPGAYRRRHGEPGAAGPQA